MTDVGLRGGGWGRFIVAEGREYVWKLNVEEENEVHRRSSTQMGVG